VLLRFDPFREIDRLSNDLLDTANSRPVVMPLDAYRHDDRWIVNIDLPGVDPSTVDLTVDRNVLTVQATRQWRPAEGDKVLAAERPRGTFTRQLMLGEQIDATGIEANYEQGVLTVTLPVAETAKPRRVSISSGAGTPATPPAVDVRSSETTTESEGQPLATSAA
jgi:HSP20 family protein